MLFKFVIIYYFTMSFNNSQQNPSNSINRYNPLALPSLKNLDVEKLESDFARELQKNKSDEENRQVSN